MISRGDICWSRLFELVAGLFFYNQARGRDYMKKMRKWGKKLTMQVMAALLAGAAMGTTAFAAEAENSNVADTADC